MKNQRLMSIAPKHFNRAVKEAAARRQATGKMIKWQDIIRHAIELGIDRAMKYTGAGQYPKQPEIQPENKSIRPLTCGSICPKTGSPITLDCPPTRGGSCKDGCPKGFYSDNI